MDACEDRALDRPLCPWPRTQASECEESFAAALGDTHHFASGAYGLVSLIGFGWIGLRLLRAIVDSGYVTNRQIVGCVGLQPRTRLKVLNHYDHAYATLLFALTLVLFVLCVDLHSWRGWIDWRVYHVFRRVALNLVHIFVYILIDHLVTVGFMLYSAVVVPNMMIQARTTRGHRALQYLKVITVAITLVQIAGLFTQGGGDDAILDNYLIRGAGLFGSVLLLMATTFGLVATVRILVHLERKLRVARAAKGAIKFSSGARMLESRVDQHHRVLERTQSVSFTLIVVVGCITAEAIIAALEAGTERETYLEGPCGLESLVDWPLVTLLLAAFLAILLGPRRSASVHRRSSLTLWNEEVDANRARGSLLGLPGFMRSLGSGRGFARVSQTFAQALSPAPTPRPTEMDEELGGSDSRPSDVGQGEMTHATRPVQQRFAARNHNLSNTPTEIYPFENPRPRSPTDDSTGSARGRGPLPRPSFAEDKDEERDMRPRGASSASDHVRDYARWSSAESSSRQEKSHSNDSSTVLASYGSSPASSGEHTRGSSHSHRARPSGESNVAVRPSRGSSESDWSADPRGGRLHRARVAAPHSSRHRAPVPVHARGRSDSRGRSHSRDRSQARDRSHARDQSHSRDHGHTRGRSHSRDRGHGRDRSKSREHRRAAVATGEYSRARSQDHRRKPTQDPRGRSTRGHPKPAYLPQSSSGSDDSRASANEVLRDFDAAQARLRDVVIAAKLRQQKLARSRSAGARLSLDSSPEPSRRRGHSHKASEPPRGRVGTRTRGTSQPPVHGTSSAHLALAGASQRTRSPMGRGRTSLHVPETAGPEHWGSPRWVGHSPDEQPPNEELRQPSSRGDAEIFGVLAEGFGTTLRRLSQTLTGQPGGVHSSNAARSAPRSGHTQGAVSDTIHETLRRLSFLVKQSDYGSDASRSPSRSPNPSPRARSGPAFFSLPEEEKGPPTEQKGPSAENRRVRFRSGSPTSLRPPAPPAAPQRAPTSNVASDRLRRKGSSSSSDGSQARPSDTSASPRWELHDVFAKPLSSPGFYARKTMRLTDELA